MSTENTAASAPVHRLVGQLREMMRGVTTGPWRVLTCDNGFAIAGGIVKYNRDDAGDINGPIGNKANADAIVAALPALPALLAELEALREVEKAARETLDHMDSNDVPAWQRDDYLALGESMQALDKARKEVGK